MGSDDVREKAEAVARDLFTNGEPRRFAYLVLRDTPGNLPGEGGSWSERAVADRIAAALAVAPATAQPVACPLAPAWRIELWAEQIRVAWVDWALTQPNPKPSWLVPWDRLDEQSKDADRAIARRLLALYATPPATGDAAAVREACAKACDRLIARYDKAPGAHEAYGAYTHVAHRAAVRLCAAAIRALPVEATLPAPATAVVGSVRDQGPDEGSARVEEARKALSEAVAKLRPVYHDFAMADAEWPAPMAEEMDDLIVAHDALLAAEAAKGGAK
jgi:phage baseplate assembly protein gpV